MEKKCLICVQMLDFLFIYFRTSAKLLSLNAAVYYFGTFHWRNYFFSHICVIITEGNKVRTEEEVGSRTAGHIKQLFCFMFKEQPI